MVENETLWGIIQMQPRVDGGHAINVRESGAVAAEAERAGSGS